MSSMNRCRNGVMENLRKEIVVMGITKSSVADSRPPHASRNPHAGDNYRASGLVHRLFLAERK